MRGFQEFIGQLGIFMICAQAILHFRPKEAYGKYMRLLLGLMVLVQIFQPFCNFFFGMEGNTLQESLSYFQMELERSMERAVEQAAESEDLLEQMSLTEIRERMAEKRTAAKQEQDGSAEQDMVGQEVITPVRIDPVEVKEVLP